jgi:hypothetical protein
MLLIQNENTEITPSVKNPLGVQRVGYYHAEEEQKTI